MVVGGPTVLWGCRIYLIRTHTLYDRRKVSHNWFVNVRLAHSRLVRPSDTVHRAIELLQRKRIESKQNNTLRRGGTAEGNRRKRKPELHRTELIENRNFLVKLLVCPCYIRFIIDVMRYVVTVVWRRRIPGGVSLVGSPLRVSSSGGTLPGSGGVRLPIPGTPRLLRESAPVFNYGRLRRQSFFPVAFSLVHSSLPVARDPRRYPRTVVAVVVVSRPRLQRSLPFTAVCPYW